jgi:NAD-dependent deacetylase
MTALAELIAQARRITVLSGAGLSTESGIPDFRSPGGTWEQYQPVDFYDFLSRPSSRREHWRYKSDTWKAFNASQPNAGHRALVRLQAAGKLTGVITQNIDGLHQLSGLPGEKVLEIHGSNRHIHCLGAVAAGEPGGPPSPCGYTEDAAAFHARLSDPYDWPPCPRCGSWLKPATVMFGQPMSLQAVQQATDWALQCDVFLVLGSSLLVGPANQLPLRAQFNGAKLVLLNRDPTPIDAKADLVLRESLGKLLEAAVP